MKNGNERRDQSQTLASGLGWFSIGLGMAELMAPDSVARLIGVRSDAQSNSILRAYGAREIANGMAILSQPDRAGWMWGRVGGDAVDLLTLAQAETTDPGRRLAATLAVLGVTAVDIMCARLLTDDETRPYGSVNEVQVTEAVTINRPIEEAYNFWRDFANFPRFMRHIESVEVTGRRSRWRAKGPAGVTVEWDADLLEDVENERISWRSLENSDVEHHGSVQFAHAPGSRGTEVRVHLHYKPPAGRLGRGIAWLLGRDPESQIREDLRRFKQLLETGEVVLSDGPALWRAAQPPAETERLKSLAGVRS